jgi:hypothetical protein
MYYVIDYLTNPLLPDPEEGPFLEIHEEDISVEGADLWQTGDRFEERIATPIEFEATPHGGYKGPPHDYFDGSIAFMSPRLVKVLRDNGVENLDLYPAVVKYRTTGETHSVFAFNLLGLISAVDEGKSQLSSVDGDFKMDSSIQGFEVDPSKARDLGMFRLAENSMTVLVHERIKRAIEAAGINTFAFVEPTDWTQL